jgi:hypothetical protein
MGSMWQSTCLALLAVRGSYYVQKCQNKEKVAFIDVCMLQTS